MMYGPDDLVCPILVWSQSDYERARTLSEDDMPETFAGWQEQFRNALRALPAGSVVVRVKADPDEVAQWCRDKGLNITSENRARWTVERFLSDKGEKA